MITLIIQIVLTIKAWKKGWKGWALLPAPTGWVISFFTGLSYGSVAGPEASLAPLIVIGLLIDLISIGVLIAMVNKGRQYSTRNKAAETVFSVEGEEVDVPGPVVNSGYIKV